MDDYCCFGDLRHDVAQQEAKYCYFGRQVVCLAHAVTEDTRRELAEQERRAIVADVLEALKLATETPASVIRVVTITKIGRQTNVHT